MHTHTLMENKEESHGGIEGISRQDRMKSNEIIWLLTN